ncbi:bacillithiol biosynthesis cysteine-adding enzyme BshC [Paenibacillus sp. JX-17]|uniref:Putative cysteine ligase BshC n=1 Tax=Paenibacillus lacisoli TaxID=3064525 RepID=A0ABT9C879_9BACL|nr:bacillithiol biosynthesis cysteine-adding enzyme BshC [Paenibacillus sp. JX-17]MDO7905416.1 bacillithiol biosynthesis cysteine-adding enzyme BshC [Paenibacillus sp. JX-17]
MNVVPEALRSGSTLAVDYREGAERASVLYTYNYRNQSSYAERVKWLDQSEDTRLDRRAVARCLRLYNGKHNSHEAVHKALDQLEQPETLVVTGGQQSGLFTGPLLVIYKAATIIKAAREAQAELNRPVVPVFWIAGEDHDWDEVNHTYVLSSNLDLKKIKLEQQTQIRSSVSQIELASDAWDGVLQELEQLLPDSEYKQDTLLTIQNILSQSASLSDAFAKMLASMFGKYGLILLDSADPELRALEKSVFKRMIENNDLLERTYLDTAKRITDMGYELQAEAAEGAANLFYIHEGERRLLFKAEEQFVDRRGFVAFSKEALITELESHPERFSNNVLTRPLMQDSILPVLGVVLGQGEIAYWAMTRDAFEVFGLQMPVLIPRLSYTLIDPAVHKHMDRHELSFQDVLHRFDARKEAWLDSLDQLGLDGRFNEVMEQFKALYTPLVEQLEQIEKGLVKLGETNQSRILEELQFMQQRSREALARRNETGLKQWERVIQSLYPLGRPQERVYNIYQVVNRFGWTWLDELMEQPADFKQEHYTIYL